MGQALYRKYRSKSLDELVGQEHVAATLKHALEQGKISHAYLFTGPRGVGKTSVARILAHAVNDVPYTGENTHLDIIEIDAASSGGVEEVRDLRDKVYITPASGKYKVYIIDEVHMMTGAAFNALLKTLEEPPAHAIFILATTEAHKVPATIVSRTQRFVFRPIPREQMVQHLRHIADEEKMAIADGALELIAEHSEGSFRDAIQMLDQAAAQGKAIERETMETLLGIPSAAVSTALLAAINAHDAPRTVAVLAQARQSGFQAALLARQLGQDLREQLLAGTSPLPPEQALHLLERLLNVAAAARSEQLLEIVLLEAAFAGTITTPTATQPATLQPMAQPPAAPTAPPTAAPPKMPDVAPKQNSPAPEPTETASTYTVDPATWQALLDTLKKQYNTLYGIIRMAQPEFMPGRIALTFGFAFHQKRANDPKNKKLISTTLETLTGQVVAIECRFDAHATPPAPLASAQASAPASAAAAPALAHISTIFGGGEVVKPGS